MANAPNTETREKIGSWKISERKGIKANTIKFNAQNAILVRRLHITSNLPKLFHPDSKYK